MKFARVRDVSLTIPLFLISAFAYSGNDFSGFGSVGLGAAKAYSDIDAEGRVNGSTVYRESGEDDVNAGNLSLRAGIAMESSRGYLNYQLMPFEDATANAITGSYDWMFSEGPARPYAGISMGIFVMDIEGETIDVGGGRTVEIEDELETSFGAGVQAGVIMDLDQDWFVDFGIRFLRTSIELEVEDEFMVRNQFAEIEVTQELTHVFSGAITIGKKF